MKKVIFTNISNGQNHDLIMFPSIEKQVFDFFASDFVTTYEHGNFSSRTLLCLVFILDGTRCGLYVGREGVELSLIASDDIRFGERKYPSILFRYNEDITNDVAGFSDTIRRLQDLEKQARALPPLDKMAIETILDREIGTDYFTVSYCPRNLFDGLEIGFFIHPKNMAPADGMLVCFDRNNKITPWWNCSTPRRTPSDGEPECIEQAVGKFATNLAMMKRNVGLIEQLKANLDKFDPYNCRDLLPLFNLKYQANMLLREFSEL